ncbi:NAD-dependent epimerase/dehydratase family protein [Agromyces aerolatus]|uniref:NAD-dependent epimerase/dehydratase family protein n=1 Tax=Agromyces sp. LY-1074 TaxID=3074080 RepID=UPI002865F6C9|nr:MULTISPECIES: NAD-dependent epimerase/dehydratase family protein [unclassified Agromyces]MDR5699771.1 NAD-dependent epimerase/dehydratase family protein [Agromyces sp. LY-1074]MDR5706067.1 NAD-dependent epimerase/dehydratase family protein [Agromyces sp. LY-1358]
MSAKLAGAVIVTGGFGFAGSRVVSALELRGLQPWRLSRVQGGARVVVGDLTDADRLTAVVAGAGAIVHCASYAGSDVEEQRRVNVEGTRNLVAAACASGVQRLVAVGTSGVYGGVLGTGHAEGAISVRPGSASARSRAAADALIIEAGGTVVRPNLVFGAGDRRTITPLLAAMVRLDAWIADPDALVSVIDVGTLGRLVAALVSTRELPRVLHAAYPRPVRIRDLIQPFFDHAGMRAPERFLSFEDAVSVAGAAGFSRRQISMVAMDNWFNSGAIWKVTGLQAAPEIQLDDDTLDYYAACLTSCAAELA